MLCDEVSDFDKVRAKSVSVPMIIPSTRRSAAAEIDSRISLRVRTSTGCSSIFKAFAVVRMASIWVGVPHSTD